MLPYFVKTLTKGFAGVPEHVNFGYQEKMRQKNSWPPVKLNRCFITSTARPGSGHVAAFKEHMFPLNAIVGEG